jgi:hypothetical protein
VKTFIENFLRKGSQHFLYKTFYGTCQKENISIHQYSLYDILWKPLLRTFLEGSQHFLYKTFYGTCQKENISTHQYSLYDNLWKPLLRTFLKGSQQFLYKTFRGCHKGNIST